MCVYVEGSEGGRVEDVGWLKLVKEIYGIGGRKKGIELLLWI